MGNRNGTKRIAPRAANHVNWSRAIRKPRGTKAILAIKHCIDRSKSWKGVGENSMLASLKDVVSAVDSIGTLGEASTGRFRVGKGCTYAAGSRQRVYGTRTNKPEIERQS
eukprot:scaffold179_cov373-Pavlova_lutheri.AAC.4